MKALTKKSFKPRFSLPTITLPKASVIALQRCFGIIGILIILINIVPLYSFRGDGLIFIWRLLGYALGLGFFYASLTMRSLIPNDVILLKALIGSAVGFMAMGFLMSLLGGAILIYEIVAILTAIFWGWYLWLSLEDLTKRAKQTRSR